MIGETPLEVTVFHSCNLFQRYRHLNRRRQRRGDIKSASMDKAAKRGEGAAQAIEFDLESVHTAITNVEC